MASGGQIIARMARKQMALPQDQGTKAFEFGPVGCNLRGAACQVFLDLCFTPAQHTCICA